MWGDGVAGELGRAVPPVPMKTPRSPDEHSSISPICSAHALLLPLVPLHSLWLTHCRLLALWQVVQGETGDWCEVQGIRGDGWRLQVPACFAQPAALSCSH